MLTVWTVRPNVTRDWGLMTAVIGYLRRYNRWDGTPGATIEEQKAAVRRIIHELDWRDDVSLEIERPAYRYEIEGNDRWLLLNYLIGHWLVDDNSRSGRVLVIPTLDGVTRNLSFLEILADPDCRTAAIVVCDGETIWDLGQTDQFDRFAAKVEKLKKQQKASPALIKAGLKRAKEHGTPLGGRCPGAHRFTAEEQAKGRRASAERRKRTAESRFKAWLPEMTQRSNNGQSLGLIARWLSRECGKDIDRQTVYRVLKRDKAAPDREISQFA